MYSECRFKKKKKKGIVLIYSQRSNSKITNIQALYLMYLISNNSGLAMLIELSSCATDCGTEGTEMKWKPSIIRVTKESES